MNISKVTLYLFFVFILGLAQSWALMIVLWYKSHPVSLDYLLKDGGIFFFSTSLVYTSFFSLFDRLKLQTIDKLISSAAITIVSFLSVIGYSIEISESLILNIPYEFIGRYGTGQIVCICVAGIYGFYSAAKLGVFRNSRYATF
ncbi:MAG: hypothetical protein HQL69_02520 [Magnetococcales bacterium]|nr:hypothetical protein [Magnetococcales bacterium]